MSEAFARERVGDAKQQVRAEAAGHLPAESGLIPPDGRTHAVTLALKSAKAAAGQVLGVDGKPAARVKVYQLFEIKSDVFHVIDGQVPKGESLGFKTATTGADGRFALAAGGAYVLFAQTPEGYLLAGQAQVERSSRASRGR